jgi:DNA-binding transcriptional regulator GbsR (MarR family)
MTEITNIPVKLPPAVQRFVLHWGEMGAVWGTNRSVGQIHALLYLSDKPLTAEDLAETLGLARSNVSNSLKELLAWNLIRRVHVMGDRRDFFSAETDLWEMVTRIAEGRKAREIDPTLAMLKTCLDEANGDHFMSRTARERIGEMHDFLGMIDSWAGQMRRVPRAKLNMLLRLGAAIVRYIPGRRGDVAGEEQAVGTPKSKGAAKTPP